MSDEQVGTGSAIGKIASVMGSARGAKGGGGFLSPGDVSELRRMDVGVPCGAFWRLMVAFVPERERAGDEAERRWALACKGMAVMSPNAHDGTVPPGRALALTGYSSEDRPIRINRLMRATDESFDDLFMSACRFLAAKAQPVDWRSFARFAIERDETQRKRLARDFYSRGPASAEAA